MQHHQTPHPIDPNGALRRLLKINQGTGTFAISVFDTVLECLGCNPLELHFCKPHLKRIWEEKYATLPDPSNFLHEAYGFIQTAKQAWLKQSYQN